jgi:DNA modification methylase
MERLRNLIAEMNDVQPHEVSHREIARVAQVSAATVTMGMRVAQAVRKGHTELLESNSVAGAYRKLQGMEALATRIAQVKAAVPTEELARGMFNGDAREWIKTLANSSVDLWMFDLPWGIEIDSYDRAEAYEKWSDEYEQAMQLARALVPEAYRTLKDNSYLVFFFGDQFTERMRRMLEHASCCQGKNHSKHTPVGFHVPAVSHIWYKPNKQGAQNDSSRFEMNQYEPFFVCSKGEPRLFKQGGGNVLPFDMPPRNERFHTTQKSLLLAKEIISRYSFGNMIVGDPTAGSFVFLKAAKALGRVPIGCELDKNNFDQGLIYMHEPEGK